MKHTEIETIKDFANYLRCDSAVLENVINNGYSIKKDGIESKNSYTEIVVSKFDIKKKGKTKGYRTVYKCWSHFLSSSLKILNTNLSEVFAPNNHTHGFVKGKNIRTNAACHLGKKLLLSVDIENYFESISKDIISKKIEQLGFQKQVAEWISIVTTINGTLVQGFPTSPTLANIVTQQLDDELNELCGSQITYTRYADDLYFSTNLNKIPLVKITEVIENYGFKLNEKKTKFMSRGKKQYVTGLTVFDSKYPRISKNRKRSIRLEIYYIQKFGYKKHIRKKLIKSGVNPKDPNFKSLVSTEIEITRNRLYGWLHFINAIEPDFSSQYYSKLKKAKQ